MVLLASDFDKSRYLKAADLDREKKFRIESVTKESIGAGADKEDKLVVWFTNDERGLVLNKTNNRTLRGAYGDTVDSWNGKIIIVFPTSVDMRGKMTPALRVRIPPPKQQPAAIPSKPAPSGNGASTAPTKQQLDSFGTTEKAAALSDPELEADPVKPLADEMDDEIPFNGGGESKRGRTQAGSLASC